MTLELLTLSYAITQLNIPIRRATKRVDSQKDLFSLFPPTTQ